ncbi:MAG: sulfite exporter TauE/SafE family protein [Planctomycetota bacterium]
MDGSCCSPIQNGPLYLQLLGPGTVWIMLHCAGMCGPLVAGLGLSQHGWRTGLLQLSLYQIGRLLPLAGAGALAGLVGSSVAEHLAGWGAWSVIVLAGGLYLTVFHRLGWLHLPGNFTSDGGLTARLLRPLSGWSSRHPHAGVFAFGLALSALPCGIVFSTLGLAVASASPWDGAALMSLLVLISTLPLAIAVGASAAAFGRLRQRLSWLPTVALTISATLLLLHGLAALHVIAHLHLGRIMLW